MLETYTESGGTVTAIRNMVSGSDDMAEATNPPAVSSINGRVAMKGDGSNDKLVSSEAAAVAPFIGTNRPVTVVIACQPDPATAQSAAIFCAGNSGIASNNTNLFLRQSVAGIWRMRRTDDAALQKNVARNDAVQFIPQVVSFITNGTHAQIYVNQDRTPQPRPGPTPNSEISTGTITPNQLGILCRADSSADSFSADRVGAILVFDRALYVPDLRGIIAAMMGRWGIPA
jgi:hypothetical protein